MGGQYPPLPDCRHERLEPGDRLMLCSDGVWSALSDERIRAMLESEAPPEAVARKLVNEALRAGSRDNATAIVVRVEPDSDA